MDSIPLFTSGSGGYVRYRIPALSVTRRGTLLAFCEARQFTGRDSDQIDLLLRRSLDGGSTFEPPQRILHRAGWVCGNPAPLLDHASGLIWLLFCQNRREASEEQICRGEAERSVWVTCSRDDGLTWEQPREISAAVKPAGWAWYATGPGHGIQLQSGRLLVACNHSLLPMAPGEPPRYASHVILSEDHGQTWRVGGSAPRGTNESAAVEIEANQVYLNCRNAPGTAFQPGGLPRRIARSVDGGDIFAGECGDPALLEPVCQASLCRLADGRVLFCNPAGERRERLTVRWSADGCRTWAGALCLHPGPAAYSDLCILPDGRIGCLYEGGSVSPYETLAFTRIELAWLAQAG